jgi:mRNA-degrading endonuclease YafQ of YafQ-DinJ toxin-antitoxin module
MLAIKFTVRMKQDVYTINEKKLILFATRTGTHADFGW